MSDVVVVEVMSGAPSPLQQDLINTAGLLGGDLLKWDATTQRFTRLALPTTDPTGVFLSGDGSWIKAAVGSATVVVAASNASDRMKRAADFVCDGVADEVEINAAILALPDIVANEGGTVLLSEGGFSILSDIIIEKYNVSLKGIGGGNYSRGGVEDANPQSGGTVIRLDAAFAGTYGIKVQPTNATVRSGAGCHLSGFSLDGFGAGAPFVNASGIFWQVSMGWIYDVNITRVQGNGLVVDGGGSVEYPLGAWDNRFIGMKFTDCGNDLVQVTNSASDNVFLGCKFIHQVGGTRGRYGVYNDGAGQQFVGCHFFFITSWAIFANVSRQLQISACRFTDCYSGAIWLQGAGEGAGFNIVGIKCRSMNHLADPTVDLIHVEPSAVMSGGIIDDVTYVVTNNAQQVRYVVNIASSNMVGCHIGAISTGAVNPGTKAFTTALVNNAGTRTRRVSGDRISLYGDGSAADVVATTYSDTLLTELTGRRARGSEAAPRRVQTNDVLLRLGGVGAASADDISNAVMATASRARIEMTAIESWTSTAQGAQINFFTTPVGSASAQLRGSFTAHGLDFNFGNFTTKQLRFKNNVPVVGRNAADTGDLELFRVNTTDQLEFRGIDAASTRYSDTLSPVLIGGRFRGSEAAPRRVQTNDILLQLAGTGGAAVDDASLATIATGSRARIDFAAIESWTSAAQGAQINFYATPTGSTLSQLRASIGSNGLDLNFGNFTTRQMRFKNNVNVSGRNAAGTGDVDLFKINTADRLELMAHMTIVDAKDINFSTGTGTRLGTTALQKMALWGATPTTQPTAVADAAGGATIDAEARAAINALLDRMRTIGAIAT